MNEATSVGAAFPREQERVRGLLELYRSIGPAGSFGALMIEGALKEAEEAMASGDVVRIISAYAALKGCE